MNSLAALCSRLERSRTPDRRLDAEVIAAVLGPPGCVIDPVCGLDGHDIELLCTETGETVYWREADDIPGVTAFLDAACEVVTEVCPAQAAKLLARALRQLPEPNANATGAEHAGRAARAIMAELVRTVAMERAVKRQAA